MFNQSIRDLGSITVREGLQESHNGGLLFGGQTKIAQFPCVEVRGHFWRRLAVCIQSLCFGIVTGAHGFYIPGIVEVHNTFQALEIPVVPVGFHETINWPLVHIA
jgi:hypothetical protein